MLYSYLHDHEYLTSSHYNGGNKTICAIKLMIDVYQLSHYNVSKSYL
jgi:hypothetical protein